MQSSKEYFRSISLFYWSLLLLQIIGLASTIWFLRIDREKTNDIIYIVSDTILVLICYYIAYFVAKKKIKFARIKLGLREKLSIYKKAIFSRLIFSSLVSFCSLASYIMTKEPVFIFITIFSISVFLLNRPTINSVSEDLELTEKDHKILENPKSAI